jgi:hypothetical protein
MDYTLFVWTMIALSGGYSLVYPEPVFGVFGFLVRKIYLNLCIMIHNHL